MALPLVFVAGVSWGSEGDPTQQRLPSGGGAERGPIRFVRDVVPALTKAGCNAGACHGSFQGKGGFQLSLLGFDPAFDFDVLTKASRGRRVLPAAAGRSLLVAKPTGVVPHGGGVRIASDSEVAEILRTWIAAGMPPPDRSDRLPPTLTVEPAAVELARPVVTAEEANNASRGVPLRVIARWPDGSSRDVTPWALYDARDKSVAEVSRGGEVVAHRPGRTSVSVRYLGQVATVTVSVPFGPPADFDFPATNYIDEIAAEEWRRLGTRPAPLVDDATFVRRVYLDLIGTLPTADEARAFIAQRDADKRSQLIDHLLERPEYVDYWSLRWGDLLRSHRRYLGEKGLASLNGWIRQSVRDNKPLDKIARELLTAQGNLFTNGPVAYYFIDERVEELAETTAQVFLGVRLQCTRCHHHPHEVWSQEDYYGLAAFFTKLETKDSGTQGAKFGGPKSIRVSSKENPNRLPKIVVGPRLLGTPASPEAVVERGAVDPRQQLANWLVQPDNPYFARNFANRTWAALFGIGLVEPVDDLRGTNPPSMPGLLDRLAGDLVEHHFDMRHLLRTICNSRTYQLAVELRPERDLDGALFTHRHPRRLAAEVFLDAVNQVVGAQEEFAGQPKGTRAIGLPDPTIASQFLTTFGRPMRNSACDCARGSSLDLSQVLHLANNPALNAKIAAPSGRLAEWLRAGRADDLILDELYFTALARAPTAEERKVVQETLASGPTREEAWQDIVWAMLNCAEFGWSH